MNTKKNKNKKPNKSPNINPQQIHQNISVPEKVDDIPIAQKVESELNIDERVPEITSDVIVSDIGKEVEVESPKKPKRNRGKKKKQDKDPETDEKQEDTATQLILDEDKKAPADIKISEIELEAVVSETQDVTPTARKKKNKNKAISNKDTPPFEEEKVEKILVVSDMSEIKMDIAPLDITAEDPLKPIEEVKPVKKKNKKKKRHDSEKSDKVEEISSSPAFHEINVEDKKSDELFEQQKLLESITSVEDLTGNTEVVPEVKRADEILQLNQENVKDEDVDFKAGSGKNKKKNKKSKSKITKIDDGQQVQSSSESQCDVGCEDSPTILIDIIKPVTDMTGNKDKSEISTGNVILEPTILNEEETDKPKPTIAKPVDKKRKEISHFDAKVSRSVIASISEDPKNYEKENAAKDITDSLDIKEVELQEVMKPKEIPNRTEELKDEAILTSLVELINIPQSSMGKKRKKSPKPTKETQKIKNECDQHSKTHESEKYIKSRDESLLVSEPVIPIEKPVSSDQEKDIKILDPLIVLKSEPDPIQEILTVPSEAIENVLPASKSGKKRKKSPKPTAILNIAEINEPAKAGDQNITEAEQTSEEQKHRNDEKTDIFFDMPHMEDLEIRSVKADESEGSICEVMPDSIQYPRAISQQHVDDNNNTVIQDITQRDDTKLTIPIMIPDTPFIQGDIPLASPEISSPGVRVTDTEVPVATSDEPEKTDLKSKMMEVNQDMEELRLSIEKSLAELTSMEKKEQNVEKQYEEQIQNQPQDLKLVITETIQTTDINSTAVRQGVHDIDLSTQNKNVTTVIQPNPIISETVLSAPLIFPMPTDIIKEVECVEEGEEQKIISATGIPLPPPMPIEIYTKREEIKPSMTEKKSSGSSGPTSSPPICPTRKDHKGKNKSKRKGKQEAAQTTPQTESTSASTKEVSNEGKSEQKSEKSQEKGKQHCNVNVEDANNHTKEPERKEQILPNFEPIENFEDAMTSSIDDVNKSFEMIANEAQTLDSHVNPEIKIIAPLEETKIEKKDEKVNPVSQPKNLLGHPVIPARSNKMDYKKEKNKTPNAVLAKVKIKDSIQIEKKQSKESQTDNIQKFMKKKSIDESFSSLMNENEEFVYKYNFRRVFLPSVCHVCKKDVKQTRVACGYCNLLFYCNTKHKDEDWPQHQALCFAVSTIVHLKGQKHIYEDAKNVTGLNYRLLRMQMIVSCEKILKRKLMPWEQEILLYPRMCANLECREWRQNKLIDCDTCGQTAYCLRYPEHLPSFHKRWCKSYSLYQKLVCHQQTKGRLEPKLPSGVLTDQYQIPESINEVLASLYKEKIDMTDVEYAALTQLATAPLTAAYGYQMYNNKMNTIYANGTYKKTSFTIHVVGAELQFEADALNKWELFFLHLRPDIQTLTICLIAPDLNPSRLPLDLLGRVRLCEYCRQDKRRLLFSFQDKKTYSEYYVADDFTAPDMVCTFNPSIQRSSVYNGKDTWPATINTILKQKIPFIITSYSMEELCRDLGRIKECSQIDFNLISEPKRNSFSSVRPDRNFITDDEMPLLFKNYCFVVVCAVF